MKKTFILFTALLLCMQASSQGFFTKTTYRGAFGSEDWTAGWANWDPQSTVYPAATSTVSSDITSNTTWAAGSVIELKNKVYVTSGATLTIQPGVIIRGDKATEGTLIISRGSKIMAMGTDSQPIVFTSNFAAGSRAPGDWGGIIILGAAPNNQGMVVVEGGLDPVKAEYGGSNNADNSGVFQYVRIEFAGFPFQPDKEINGLTMGSVGSGTTIDHIQVSFCNDDSFEWFGGSVNCKYLISYRCVDDEFDTDFGYSGMVQFALGVRDPNLADQCTCSTSEGFESDNDGTGTAATPKTSAVFSNVTLIGPYRGSTSNTVDTKLRRALRIRRNSALSIMNSVFTDWPGGLHIDGSASEANAANGELEFKCNTLAGMGAGKNLQLTGSSSFDIKTFFASNNNDSLINAADIKLKNPYSFTNPDFRPDSSSSLWGNVCFDDVGIIEPVKNENVKIFLSPSPAKEEVNVSLSLQASFPVSVRIMDIAGKSVAEISRQELAAGKHDIRIPLSQYQPGLYFVIVQSGDSRQVSRLVISR